MLVRVSSRACVVLLVEDDEDVAEAVVDVLNGDGYVVVHARDGALGLAIAQRGGVDRSWMALRFFASGALVIERGAVRGTVLRAIAR